MPESLDLLTISIKFLSLSFNTNINTCLPIPLDNLSCRLAHYSPPPAPATNKIRETTAFPSTSAHVPPSLPSVNLSRYIHLITHPSETHTDSNEQQLWNNVPIRKHPLRLWSRRTPSNQTLPLCPQRPKPSMLRRLVRQERVVESYRVLSQLCVLCQTENFWSCSLRDLGSWLAMEKNWSSRTLSADGFGSGVGMMAQRKRRKGLKGRSLVG
jgi:hypothetical protein